VAAWVPDMFCGYYLMKNYKVDKNSATTKAREKISTELESLEFFFNLIYIWQNLKTLNFLLNKISDRFLVMTKLVTK
jgi:hypothetical protein